MEVLKLDKSEAIKLFPKAEELLKKILISTFGAECFSGDVTDRVKTFADACLEVGTTEKAFNERFNNLGLDEDTINYEKAKIITKSLNEDWIPDWDNSNQEKWSPWFNLSSGFGFDGSGCGYRVANAGCGSRLCFKNQKLSDYAGKTFTEIYSKFIK